MLDVPSFTLSNLLRPLTMKLKEFYKWELQLRDGTVVKQSADNETEPFKFDNRNSNFKNIEIFKLIPKEQDSSLREFKLVIPENALLIYFRRTIANTGNLFPKFQVNLVGWQLSTGGKKVKQITYLYPDGRIENTPDSSTLIEEFVAGLPQKELSDIVGCSGCKPRLERTKSDE